MENFELNATNPNAQAASRTAEEQVGPGRGVTSRPRGGWMGVLALVWALVGVALLLGFALVRLTPIALEAFAHPLAWHHWAVLVTWTGFMVYSEGIRGFQRSFSPRVAVRAHWLRRHPTPLRALLAPAWAIGYLGGPRRVQVTTLSVTAGIVALVLVVHRVPQPWRGIVDAGVVAGLLWGLASTLILALRPEALPDDPGLLPGA